MSAVTITCPHCLFSKQVEPGKIPAGLKQVKCPKCSQGFPLQRVQNVPHNNVQKNQVTSPTTGSAHTAGNTTAAPERLSQFKFCSSCGKKINVNAEICPGCGVRISPPQNAISKVSLLLITFFLGGFGGHKFYVKKYLQGVFYLLFFWTYIPTLASLIEFIIYAIKSEPELQERYPESASGIIALVVIIPVFISMIGILAAIAIPQFAAYRQKAYNSLATNDLEACKVQAEEYFEQFNVYPTVASQMECSTAEKVALYYLSFGSEEYQLVSFHTNGNKAFINDSTSFEIAEYAREEIELEIKEKYGATSLGTRFHFFESSMTL